MYDQTEQFIADSSLRRGRRHRPRPRPGRARADHSRRTDGQRRQCDHDDHRRDIAHLGRRAPRRRAPPARGSRRRPGRSCRRTVGAVDQVDPHARPIAGDPAQHMRQAQARLDHAHRVSRRRERPEPANCHDRRQATSACRPAASSISSHCDPTRASGPATAMPAGQRTRTARSDRRPQPIDQPHPAPVRFGPARRPHRRARPTRARRPATRDRRTSSSQRTDHLFRRLRAHCHIWVD